MGRRGEVDELGQFGRVEHREAPGHDAVGGRLGLLPLGLYTGATSGKGSTHPKIPAMNGDLMRTASSGSSPKARTEAPCTAPRNSRSTFSRCSARALGASGSGTAAHPANNGAAEGDAPSLTCPSSSARRP